MRRYIAVGCDVYDRETGHRALLPTAALAREAARQCNAGIDTLVWSDDERS